MNAKRSTRPTHLGVAFLLVLLISFILKSSPAMAGGPTCQGAAATIVGDNDSETINGTNGDDVIVAGGGSDLVSAKQGDDVICGQGGNDHLAAGSGEDRMSGGPGDDMLVGGASTQLLDGGVGVDVFFPSGGSGGDIRGGRGGDWLAFSDRLCSTGVNVDLAARTAAYVACPGWKDGSWLVSSVAHVDGSDGHDVIAGSDGRNLLLGQEGSDELEGRPGDDRLYGGPGRDRGEGGAGRDRCQAVEVARSCR